MSVLDKLKEKVKDSFKNYEKEKKKEAWRETNRKASYDESKMSYARKLGKAQAQAEYHRQTDRFKTERALARAERKARVRELRARGQSHPEGSDMIMGGGKMIGGDRSSDYDPIMGDFSPKRKKKGGDFDMLGMGF